MPKSQDVQKVQIKSDVYVAKDTYDKLCKLARAYINENGEEVNNPKPHQLAANLDRPISLQEQIQRVLRTELSDQAASQGFETMEESQDFDVEEDFLQPAEESIFQIIDEEVPPMPEDPPPGYNPPAETNPDSNLVGADNPPSSNGNQPAPVTESQPPATGPEQG